MSVQTEQRDDDSGDAFDIGPTEEGGWCKFCPAFCGLGTMTFLMALLGFGFGAILFEENAQNNWKQCYDGDDYDLGDEPDSSCWLELVYWPGMLWIRVLKLLVIPLMATMVFTLPEKLSSIAPVGVRLLALLTLTSFVASMEGLFWANVIQPGNFVSDADQQANEGSSPANRIGEFESLLNIFTLFFPSNIFDELANSRVIGTISFFLVLGIQINKGPAQWRDPTMNVAKAILRAVIRILVHVMWFTPIAMFSLIAYNIARTNDVWGVLEATGMYVLTQLLGQFCHLGLYFVFFFVTTGGNPLSYFLKIKDAPVTALITSSSAATMPVTLRANLDAGNDKRLVQFTIPLGAGMNMDGTSLGFPIMVLFAAQLTDHSVTFGQQLTLAILSMVCSLGTAPVPSAGLVFLQMLFLAVDLPITNQTLGFGLIALFDWLVDRVETAQNVTSDSFICGILTHYFRGGGGPLSCCMRGMVSEDDLQRNEQDQGGKDPEQGTQSAPKAEL